MAETTAAAAIFVPTLLEWLNRHVWLDGCDLETERRQTWDEGRDVSSIDGEFNRLLNTPVPEGRRFGGARDKAWLQDAARLMDAVQDLPYRSEYPYVEPTDLEGIRVARPETDPIRTWRGRRAQFLSRLHGGWLGRICGCMLGKPVEGWNMESIRITGEETKNWPLNNYLRLPTRKEDGHIAARKPKNELHKKQAPLLLDGMNGMVEDDDTNYTTTGFYIVKKHGGDFTPLDVATAWGANIPIFHTCTAERVAYRNFVAGVVPPESATHRNPYREWIGAQIRADYFGYANPGNPERAAAWAWRDACISHVKNGIYGEMWVAAMLAAAYVEDNWVRIVRAGLAQIPERCRLYDDVETIVDAYEEHKSYDEVVKMIHEQWDETVSHHWCHTNSNAQIVAAAVLYGEEDFEKTITRAVMPGFDTDCNGATAGSLWGVRYGVEKLPKKWTRPIKDKIRTGVAGYHEVKISAMAEEMAEVARGNW
ncbi:MAG TPA: ADP-ribosylglycohydrolase family protein [Planctomycetota bacterium]|jgi:ADP-ribosylglycohydrolase